MSHLPRWGTRCGYPIAALLCLVRAPLVAQVICDSDGRPPAPQIGYGLLQCVGGSCAIFGGRVGAFEHRFSVEPRLWRIDPAGPAAGILEEGDLLVAINGTPIVTRAGGQKLARPRAGVAVELTIRRGGVIRSLQIMPVVGCGYPMLAVTTRPELPPQLGVPVEATRPATPPFELGITLSCGGCRWVRRSENVLLWQSLEVPRILTVDPAGPAARSGLAVGDLLLTIDGHLLASDDGGRYLGTIRPGQAIAVGYSRDGRAAVTRLTVSAPQAITHLRF